MANQVSAIHSAPQFRLLYPNLSAEEQAIQNRKFRIFLQMITDANKIYTKYIRKYEESYKVNTIILIQELNSRLSPEKRKQYKAYEIYLHASSFYNIYNIVNLLSELYREI